MGVEYYPGFYMLLMLSLQYRNVHTGIFLFPAYVYAVHN